MATSGSIGLGLIGCGGFGQFCLRAFRRMEGVRLAAAADVVKEAADAVAREFHVPACYSADQLIARGDVGLVHVATPPSSHYGLVMAVLAAGKHCLCEKPLAVTVAQAEEMLAAARGGRRIVPVNFVLRYNAATEAVKAIIGSGLLGLPLSARLTNCASDTKLMATHWFWDKGVSGGIFIEHGVHFFDLYGYWFGRGKVISAHAERRDGTGMEDRVTCVVQHDGGTIASHYHGFDQLNLLDRTDHRLVFEMGDIRVDGWIPLVLEVDAAVDEKGADGLARLLPGSRMEVRAEYGDDGVAEGRGKRRTVSRRVKLTYAPQHDKEAAYASGVRDLLADQVACIRDPAHRRRITEDNGLASLQMACAAAELAEASAKPAPAGTASKHGRQ